MVLTKEPTWRGSDFDDSGWKEGAAPLGYPEGRIMEIFLLSQQSLDMVVTHKTSMQPLISEQL